MIICKITTLKRKKNTIFDGFVFCKCVQKNANEMPKNIFLHVCIYKTCWINETMSLEYVL